MAKEGNEAIAATHVPDLEIGPFVFARGRCCAELWPQIPPRHQEFACPFAENHQQRGWAEGEDVVEVPVSAIAGSRFGPYVTFRFAMNHFGHDVVVDRGGGPTIDLASTVPDAGPESDGFGRQASI